MTLGFTDEEQMSMFKTISGILHFGNIEVKQRPREEWATIPNATGREGHPLKHTHTHTHTHTALCIAFYIYIYSSGSKHTHLRTTRTLPW